MRTSFSLLRTRYTELRAENINYDPRLTNDQNKLFIYNRIDSGNDRLRQTNKIKGSTKEHTFVAHDPEKIYGWEDNEEVLISRNKPRTKYMRVKIQDYT
ncbi:hypothetical protein V1478_012548 [Vespula squamosa]|uniref:Uncharacterized protein n=1 Tax=Vespula squamosa TaxID=30214 RepID=A0ABD2AEC3_VESSQ